MLRNYIKIAIRNLWKNKGLSFINIFGLATGMACSLLIFLFVKDELSYDRFHNGSDRIYRVVKDFVNSDGTSLPDATTPPALAPAAQREIPGIEHVTRVFPNWGSNSLVTYQDKHLYTEKIYRADSSFFDVFNFPFIKGSSKHALQDVNSILITESAAKKYFGTEDPMGKVLKIDQLGDMMVAGILKDIPGNSHFHFDMLVPIKKFGERMNSNWGWYNFYTYIKLQPNTKIATVEEKIRALYKKNNPEENNKFYTQPLRNIHLDSNLKWELEPNGERLYVIAFAIVGILIVVIAAINYINLVTARSSLRAKEIGIRKVSGAYKSSLVRQFLLESVIMCLLAAALSLVIAVLMTPMLNSITAKHLAIYGQGNWSMLYLVAGAIVIGLIAGLFPALYLSSFKPVIVLKGIKSKESHIFNLRKALVVVQFSISIALIAGSLIIYQQIRYIRSTNLGLNKDQVLVIPEYYNLRKQDGISFQSELKQMAGVKAVSTTDGMVGGQNWTTRLNVKGSEKGQLVNFLSVGYDFLNILDIKMKEGRGFSEDFPADTITRISTNSLEQDIGSIVLNEKAVKDLSVPSPVIGQRIQWSTDGDTLYFVKIIGVTENFHFASFKNEIKPFAFVANPRRAGSLTAKLTTKNIAGILAQIESRWKQIAPERPMQYYFLDETFARLYKAEGDFQKVFIVLVILSVVIACLGLFGLSAFTAEQRIKEIGIRKVLGASVAGIATMLSKDFLKLVIISIVIATPMAWWAMSTWLHDYAYRIRINAWIFVLAGLLSVFIAIVTVSFQAIKAALANPVKSLKTE